MAAFLASVVALIAFKAQHCVAQREPLGIPWIEGLHSQGETKYTVLVGDELQFLYDDETQDVWRLADKAAFDKCDFTDAEEITSAELPVSYFLTAPGDYYFAQKADDGCANGIKVHLPVVDNVGGENVQVPITALEEVANEENALNGDLPDMAVMARRDSPPVESDSADSLIGQSIDDLMAQPQDSSPMPLALNDLVETSPSDPLVGDIVLDQSNDVDTTVDVAITPSDIVLEGATLDQSNDETDTTVDVTMTPSSAPLLGGLLGAQAGETAAPIAQIAPLAQESNPATPTAVAAAPITSATIGGAPANDRFMAAAATGTDGVVVKETIPWSEPITMPSSGRTVSINQYEAVTFDYQAAGPTTANVVRVMSPQELESCNLANAVTLNGQVGPYQLQFQSGGTYYLTSSIGTQCQQGLKLTVNVISATSNDPITLKGTVYYDRNNNVERDQSEGLANVPITVTQGQQVGSAMTNANGEWTVTGLPAGTYQINIGQIPGLNVTDSPGMHKTVTVEGGATSTFNFRVVGSGSSDSATIQGNIYYDRNANRQPDSGEGIANAAVTLRSSSTGATVGSTQTSQDGSYSFTVPEGSYKLNIETLPNYNVGGLPVVKDIDAAPGNIIKFNYYVTAPSQTATGFILGSIYKDTNENNNYDAGEGIQGAQVSVQNVATSQNVAQAQTDAAGAYRVEVSPGTYRVVIGPIPGYPLPATADTSKTITVEPMSENSYNFMVSGPAPSPFGSITGTVYNDTNKNSAADAGEGAGQVTLTLTNKDTGAVAGTTTTDASGSYGFESVTPGRYEVKIAKVNGEDVSFDNNSQELAVTENSRSTVDFQVDTTAAPALTNARITGAVFKDFNNNERDDSGEGIAQIKVSVQNPTTGAEVYQTSTDTNGKYELEVLPGTYDIVIAPIPGVDVPVDRRTKRIVIVAGTEVPFNFRIVMPDPTQPGAVVGTLFIDYNSNNSPDAGEGIGDVSVTAFTPFGAIVGSTRSDSQGKFSLSLAPGEYRIELGAFPDIEVPISYRTKNVTVTAASTVNFSFRVTGMKA